MNEIQRRRLLIWGAACAGGTLALPGRAAPTSHLSEQLRALLDDAQCPLPGLSVLVLRRGDVVFEGQYGQRVVASEGRAALPVTPDTLFRIASVTKLVVLLGLMRLVEAARMSLDEDVSERLGFPLRHPRFAEVAITPRLLLSHRSGLTDEGGLFFELPATLQGLLGPQGRIAAKAWGAQAPGRFFQYCNLNYGVLASVMEMAAGQRFDRLMQQEVLDPLGMAGGFDASALPPAQLAQLAVLYRKRRDEQAWDSAGPWVPQVDDFSREPPKPFKGLADYRLGSNGTLFGPQGRLRVRVRDLGTIARLLLAEGRHGGRSFLSAASVRALLSEQWRFDRQAANGDELGGLFQAWGVGLQHFIDRSEGGRGDRVYPGQLAWGHLGFAYGLHSGLLIDPERGNGIAYAISGEGADPERLRGLHSSFPLFEERLQGLLWAHAREGE